MRILLTSCQILLKKTEASLRTLAPSLSYFISFLSQTRFLKLQSQEKKEINAKET